MVSAMRHRGPDDQGIYHDGIVALGMSRLAIIDTTRAGHQPFANRDGTILLVYNGETYNFREERAILVKKGHVFNSSSDTEVVLRMYEEYGDDFVARMRGMFALAIYDKRRGAGKERLLLARDHLGIKPLLYADVRGSLIFSSEMKSILASGLIKREVNSEGVRLLLTFGSVLQPMTVVSGVIMLLPGHRLIIEGGGRRLEKFWGLGLDRIPGLRQAPYEDQVQVLRSALEESVRLQMIGDVPVGAFLSGGIDSTLLVSMMARATGTKIRTFSVGFESEGKDLDETDDAERSARFIGTEHSRIIVTGQQVRDSINDIAAALDQPSVDGVNSYFVSAAARRSVTVAISGTGGDELFAGYPWFMNMVRATMRDRKSGAASRVRAMVAKVARQRLFDFAATGRLGARTEQARQLSGFMAHFARQHRIFTPYQVARLLARERRALAQVGRDPSRDIQRSDELPLASAVERTSALCLRGYAQNQLLRDIDAVSMAQSLEVRVPFLDPVITDLAFSLSDQSKLNTERALVEQNGTYRSQGGKKILIDAGRDLLPLDIDMQKKRGFQMPFDFWLKGPLKDVVDDTLSPMAVKSRGLFDHREVAAVRNDFFQGRVSWVFPWLLAMVELWCRQVLDGAYCEK